MADKYTMFKNFMHNELGITKHDIREWVEATVKQVAKNHVDNHMNAEEIAYKIVKAATNDLSIKRLIAETVTDKITINVKE